MNKMMAALVFLALFATPVFGQPDVEQDKIAYLIASVAALQDAAFIRNGQEYDAERAAEHLRMKLRYAGDHVRTAEDFIACCATRSSMSGIRYQIRFHDGHTVDSAAFLHAKLAEYEAARRAKPAAPPGIP